MKWYQEVTEWDAGYHVPNHVYYMKDDKSKAVGYIPAGTNKYVKFKTVLTINTKGRKFVPLSRKSESDDVYFPKKSDAVPTQSAIEVEGSGGKKYYLTKNGIKWTCTCPGFTFRHTCKHSVSMK